MSSWAKPGVKCVCIKRGAWVPGNDGLRLDIHKPVYGEECVISGLSGRFFFLEGYREKYLATRFRPLVTQSDDVEMFLRIANDTPFHVMIDEGLMDPEGA